jgi:hypothetical protein
MNLETVKREIQEFSPQDFMSFKARWTVLEQEMTEHHLGFAKNNPLT